MEEVASSEQRPSNYGFVFPPPPRSKQRDSPGSGGVSKLWNVEQAQWVLYQEKGANVMIRFFWWSDPASLDTKEPKAMILFCQKKTYWFIEPKISLVAISKCGSKTPQTRDDMYHENLRVPLAQCPNSQTIVVKMWSSIRQCLHRHKTLSRKNVCFCWWIKSSTCRWVFIDVHSLSHWV